MDRLENLLGAQALALTDRLVTSEGAPSSEQGAMVTLLAHPGSPVSWLGGVLGLSSSGITRLVDRLVAEGWATRAAGSDARSRTVALTRKGRDRARRLTEARGRAMSAALDGLTAQDRVELERILGVVVAGLAHTRLPAMRVCRLCDRSACASDGLACPLDAVSLEATDD